jgi:hypothetical protein
VVARVQQAVRALDPDQRLAGIAAAALLATLVLPWYRATFVRPLEKANFSAFGVFSFVEGAILLVALGIFALLFARGERRAFHLPGGDGVVILAAGAWAALLLFWRLFDQPEIERAVEVGITWGFFFAFLAAAALAGAGWRMHVANRPEPPNPAAEEPPAAAPPPRDATAETAVARRPPDDTAATRQLTLDDEPGERREPPEPEPPLQPGEIPRAPRR